MNMNKIQKGLIGTALAATLVGTVGMGTFSSFTGFDNVGMGDNAVLSETATLDFEVRNGNGDVVDTSDSLPLFHDADNLHLLPGEMWTPDSFVIENTGNRAFDFTHSKAPQNGTRFDLFGSMATNNGLIKPEFREFVDAEVTWTVTDINGEERQSYSRSGNLGERNLHEGLLKGQTNNNNRGHSLRDVTLLPGENVEVEVTFGLAEDAPNDLQTETLGAGFHFSVEQNNEIERNGHDKVAGFGKKRI